MWFRLLKHLASFLRFCCERGFCSGCRNVDTFLFSCGRCPRLFSQWCFFVSGSCFSSVFFDEVIPMSSGRGPFILRALWLVQDRPLGFLFQAPHRTFKLSNLDSRGLSSEAFKSDHSPLPLNRLVNTEWPNAAGLRLHFHSVLPFKGSIFEQQTAFHRYRGMCGMFGVMHLCVGIIQISYF